LNFSHDLKKQLSNETETLGYDVITSGIIF